MQAIVCGCGCDKRMRYRGSYRCLNQILEILILLSHTTTPSVVKGEENVRRKPHPTMPFPRCWKKLAGITDSSTAKLRLEAAMTAILSLTREGRTRIWCQWGRKRRQRFVKAKALAGYD